MDAKTAYADRQDDPQGEPLPAPWWAWGCSAELGPGDLTNYRRFLLLALAWVASLFLTVTGLDAWGEALGPVRYGVALVPTVVFLAVIGAFVRFLREADELTRKIQVQGMAVGFGAALVCLLGYPVLEKVGAPPLDLDLVILPMMLAYVVAVYRQQRRYR